MGLITKDADFFGEEGVNGQKSLTLLYMRILILRYIIFIGSE